MEENTTNNAIVGKKGGMSPVFVVGLVLVVLGIGLVVMRTNKQVPAAGTVVPIPTTGEVVAGEVKTIKVEAGSFYYKPVEIRVKVGDKVKIEMTAVDMMHNFNIDELDVKVPLAKSGETTTAEFTASKAGTFEYYCSVGQHRQRGQVGKLVVEP